MSVSGTALKGFEVLVRDSAANDMSRAPAAYLDAIEKYGLCRQFLCQLIEQAAEASTGWEKMIGPFKLAFNVSPLIVQDRGLPDRLLDVVKGVGLDPKSVVFEITENHLLEYTAESLEVLSLLRLYGFQLSIDDFGTGATSIEQLRAFPFTELKIDGRFMMSYHEDEFSKIAVETSADLARAMEMKIVAEGVEDEAALEFARLSGAHEVQGFYFAKAMSADDTKDWLSKHRHAKAAS